MKAFAPVLIPTLCRYEHFKRCVESLSCCTGAQNTILYVALDYPKTDNHVKGYSMICQYLGSHSLRFKEIHIIKREENYGAARNMREARNLVFQRFDRIILTEDDNEFSPNFLEYMNVGFERYEEEEDILALCGYNYPIDMGDYPYNIYFSTVFSAWGCGLWRDREQYVLNYIVTKKYGKQILSSLANVSKLYRERPRLLLALLSMAAKDEVHGDTLREIYAILNDKKYVIPSVSKVRNWGQDGSGLHSGTDLSGRFTNQGMDNALEFVFDGLSVREKLDKKVDKELRIYNAVSLKGKLKILKDYLLYRLGVDLRL